MSHLLEESTQLFHPPFFPLSLVVALKRKVFMCHFGKLGE